jgi:hypothetical protein
LDAWTEYWDVYHPESRGRYYFGDGKTEGGLLTRFLPQREKPPAFAAWTQRALLTGPPEAFSAAVLVPAVADAVTEVDVLISGLFRKHFGDASDSAVQADYLHAVFQFAIDALPPATEREALIKDDDPRKPTSGRHTLDGDIMWFAWALHTEAAMLICGNDDDATRRALMLAGVAIGCPANFASRGHRRTRAEYVSDASTTVLLMERGAAWVNDSAAAVREIDALYRIREWGTED